VNCVQKINSNLKIEIIYLSIQQLEFKYIKNYSILINKDLVVVDLALPGEEAHENARLTIFG
jgi:hypothetical protein